MYSNGPLHIDEQRQDDQLEPTYSSSVPIQDVALKTYREQWTIEKGDERWPGISVLMAWHDDNDDDDDDDSLIFVIYARPGIKLMQILKFPVLIEEKEYLKDQRKKTSSKGSFHPAPTAKDAVKKKKKDSVEAKKLGSNKILHILLPRHPIFFTLTYSRCTIGPTFCAVKKEVSRKRNTQTRR